MEVGQGEIETRAANSSSSLADEDCNIVNIPESEFIYGYQNNSLDIMQFFFLIMEATKLPGYDPSHLTS